MRLHIFHTEVTIRCELIKLCEMASRTLPLLYLNLGGEMMYVLDQRLVAQKVDGAKAAKGQLSF